MELSDPGRWEECHTRYTRLSRTAPNEKKIPQPSFLHFYVVLYKKNWPNFAGFETFSPLLQFF